MGDSSIDSNWSDELVSKLIQLRYEKRDEFKTAGKRGNTHNIWMNIIRDLHMENQLTVFQVRRKWNSLLHKFKDIENKISIGSCSNELAWPFYNQMQSVMNEISSHENPSILATSNNNETVKIRFSDNLNSDENEEDKNEYKRLNRTQRDVMDERFITAIEESNEQLKVLTVMLEKQNDSFIQLMTRLVNVMENQVDDDMAM